jgi:hypothetical protein
MAEAMDLNLFLDSFSPDTDNSVEPTFIPDYRDFAFTKSELHLLLDEVIDELLKEGITSKQKKYLKRLSDIVAEMIMAYDLSYFKIHGELPDW